MARISSSPNSAPPLPSQEFEGSAVILTRQYVTFGPTARPTFPGKVQGVVVQAKMQELLSFNLNFTNTAGSETSL